MLDRICLTVLERICYAKADKNPSARGRRKRGVGQVSVAIAAVAAKTIQDRQSLNGGHLLNVREVAQLLGMSMRWVHERTRRREIPCYRFGSVLRFHPVEVQEWLVQWRETPVSAKG